MATVTAQQTPCQTPATTGYSKTPSGLLSCNTCQKTYSAHQDLVKHLASHTQEKPFACPKCDKRFTKKSHLTRHDRIHTGEKPFVCGFCQKRHARMSDLKVHLRVHTKERPYACKVCNKTFITSSHVRMHERTHDPNRQYACPTCPKVFKTKPGLTQHMKNIHAKQDAKTKAVSTAASVTSTVKKPASDAVAITTQQPQQTQMMPANLPSVAHQGQPQQQVSTHLNPQMPQQNFGSQGLDQRLFDTQQPLYAGTASIDLTTLQQVSPALVSQLLSLGVLRDQPITSLSTMPAMSMQQTSAPQYYLPMQPQQPMEQTQLPVFPAIGGLSDTMEPLGSDFDSAFNTTDGFSSQMFM
eukprot:m.5022 g.5022  ORF g.5022 m.5022 type:complete len:354 (-) comp4785_c0_seq1:581-1642(-)